MSWEGGVDLVAASAPDLGAANVIVHVARTVHTPLGSAPSGMVLIPDFADPSAPPQLMGFVSSSAEIGAYFGPKIFAGTPFEKAPLLVGSIEIQIEGETASAQVVVGDFRIEMRFSGVGAPFLIHREAGALPFVQQGIEANVGSVELWVNGQKYDVFVPEIGMTGGYGAVVAATGVYAR